MFPEPLKKGCRFTSPGKKVYPSAFKKEKSHEPTDPNYALP